MSLTFNKRNSLSKQKDFQDSIMHHCKFQYQYTRTFYLRKIDTRLYKDYVFCITLINYQSINFISIYKLILYFTISCFFSHNKVCNFTKKNLYFILFPGLIKTNEQVLFWEHLINSKYFVNLGSQCSKLFSSLFLGSTSCPVPGSCWVTPSPWPSVFRTRPPASSFPPNFFRRILTNDSGNGTW